MVAILVLFIWTMRHSKLFRISLEMFRYRKIQNLAKKCPISYGSPLKWTPSKQNPVLVRSSWELLISMSGCPANQCLEFWLKSTLKYFVSFSSIMTLKQALLFSWSFLKLIPSHLPTYCSDIAFRYFKMLVLKFSSLELFLFLSSGKSSKIIRVGLGCFKIICALYWIAFRARRLKNNN